VGPRLPPLGSRDASRRAAGRWSRSAAQHQSVGPSQFLASNQSISARNHMPPRKDPRNPKRHLPTSCCSLSFHSGRHSCTLRVRPFLFGNCLTAMVEFNGELDRDLLVRANRLQMAKLMPFAIVIMVAAVYVLLTSSRATDTLSWSVPLFFLLFATFL